MLYFYKMLIIEYMLKLRFRFKWVKIRCRKISKS